MWIFRFQAGIIVVCRMFHCNASVQMVKFWIQQHLSNQTAVWIHKCDRFVRFRPYSNHRWVIDLDSVLLCFRAWKVAMKWLWTYGLLDAWIIMIAIWLAVSSWLFSFFEYDWFMVKIIIICFLFEFRMTPIVQVVKRIDSNVMPTSISMRIKKRMQQHTNL